MGGTASIRWRSLSLWVLLIGLLWVGYRTTVFNHEVLKALNLGRHGKLPKLLGNVAVGLVDLFAISAALLVVDLLSEGRHASNLMTGMRILASAAILSAPAVVIVVLLTRQLGIAPLFTLGPNSGLLALVAFIVAWLVWEDLVSYWFHRAMHAHPTFWRFHRVHHAVQELNAFNNYEHIGEIVLRAALVTLPASILIGLPVEYLLFANWLVHARSQYIHSSAEALRLPRFLRKALVDNAYYHVHHGMDERHHNKNFATLFPVIDRLFGTQQLPEHSFCRTGLHGTWPANDIRSYLLAPWVDAGSANSRPTQEQLDAAAGEWEKAAAPHRPT